MYVIRPIISQPALPPARPFFTQIYLRSESFCWIVKVKTESNEIRLYINVSLSPPNAATKAEIISFYWSNIVEIIGISAGSAKFAIKWNLLLIPNGPMLIACVTLTCDGVLKQCEFPLVNGNKEDWTVSTSQALHITFGRLFPDFRLVFDFPLLLRYDVSEFWCWMFITLSLSLSYVKNAMWCNFTRWSIRGNGTESQPEREYDFLSLFVFFKRVAVCTSIGIVVIDEMRVVLCCVVQFQRTMRTTTIKWEKRRKKKSVHI